MYCFEFVICSRIEHNPATLGFFLQCERSETDPDWNSTATAELTIKSHKTDVHLSRQYSSHNFCAKEDDWGFPQFQTIEVQCK